jgi:hypothetical protein
MKPSTNKTAGGKMKTMVYLLSFFFVLSVSACSQGNINACTPQCDGKECGDDLCGGTCPPGCSEGETCNEAGQCTLDADTTPPYPITDLTASNSTEGSITLTWTAPGDDLATGTASEYDIRYSTASITEANWTSATEVSNEPAPQVSGTSQTHVVSSLSPDTTYYFAIKTTDDADNASALSNVASGKTLADSGVFQFYPADHYWNIPVNTLQKDPMSDVYIASQVKYNTYLYAFISTTMNIVDTSSIQFRNVTWRLWDVWDLYTNCDPDILYPIYPELQWSGVAENGENTYFIVDPYINKSWCLYDGRLNRRCENNVLIDSPGDMCACNGVMWDLGGYRLRTYACSVSGLDTLPSVVRKVELDAGVIKHALRGGFAQIANNFVYPCKRGGATAAPPAGETYPANGQRFRLKASFDISGYTRDQQVVLTALKKYGLIACENVGRDKHIISMDFEKGITGMGGLTSVKASDFEAVDFTPLIISTDSAQCRIP